MEKNNFVVVGGQYYMHYYGATPTLIGAKRLANKHEEYWDNWQGWHRPKIYRMEDCKYLEAGDWSPAGYYPKNREIEPIA